MNSCVKLQITAVASLATRNDRVHIAIDYAPNDVNLKTARGCDSESDSEIISARQGDKQTHSFDSIN